MTKPRTTSVVRAALGLILAIAAVAVQGQTKSPLVARGEYVFRAAGCAACHTDVPNEGPFLAGGRAFPTPFGTFYSPNITSHPTRGIGSWTEKEFRRALRAGVGPGGKDYYPVFPYTSYTGMTDEDAAALFAYLRQTSPVDRPSREHDLPWYFSFRISNWFWNLLFLETGPFKPDPGQSPVWNRGAYLVTALSHCAECHTPRNRIGVIDRSRWMTGAALGPDGESAPNITPDKHDGIGNWPPEELFEFLKTGGYADGDFIEGVMAEVVDDGLQYLRNDDIRAIMEYLRSVPPLRD